jgi:plasmid stabilization system protein ParE
VLEVVFLLAAEVDVQSAYEWLDEQRGGRGDQFLRHLRELELLLANNPQLGVSVGAGIRKLLLPRFDHGIFYTIEGSRIMVAAVLDLRRDPAFIRSRLGI